MQAYLWLHHDGRFRIKNVGRRHIFVNARQVEEGQEAPVIHLSMLEIGGHRFLLQVS